MIGAGEPVSTVKSKISRLALKALKVKHRQQAAAYVNKLREEDEEERKRMLLLMRPQKLDREKTYHRIWLGSVSDGWGPEAARLRNIPLP